MKVELVKIKFGKEFSYKYKPYKTCCESFKNNPCIIQRSAYYSSETNKPKKLRRIFQASFNIFFSLVSSVYNSKVINFAYY